MRLPLRSSKANIPITDSCLILRMLARYHKFHERRIARIFIATKTSFSQRDSNPYQPGFRKRRLFLLHCPIHPMPSNRLWKSSKNDIGLREIHSVEANSFSNGINCRWNLGFPVTNDRKTEARFRYGVAR